MNLAGYLLRHAFVRFALVGTGGYVVDTAMLWLGTRHLGLDPYSGRALSIFVAMIFTWAGNRTLTFAGRRARGSLGAIGWEFLRFVGANLVGALVNYGVYAWLIHAAAAPFNDKYAAQAIGVLAGLVFNFTLSRTIVFRAPPA